ncbi:hypothetical protein [Undibacterium sp. TJN19]
MTTKTPKMEIRELPKSEVKAMKLSLISLLLLTYTVATVAWICLSQSNT